MTEPEGNYVPYKRDSSPFIWYEQSKSSEPSLVVRVENPKKPLGFADWPEDPKPEWRKA